MARLANRSASRGHPPSASMTAADVPLAASIEVPEEPTSIWSQSPQLRHMTQLLEKHLGDLHDDCESLTRTWLNRARLYRQSLASPAGPRPANPFARMKHVQHPPESDGRLLTTKLIGKVFDASLPQKGESISLTAPITSWTKRSAVEVPSYMDFTRTERNVLGSNAKQLQVWPYFGDDVADDSKVYDELRDHFHVAVDDRPRKVLLSQQAQTYGPYFQAFLDDIACPMDHVLKYFLEISDDLLTRLIKFARTRRLSRAGTEVRQMFLERNIMCKDDFNNLSVRWVAVRSTIPELTDEELWKAALACHTFWTMTKFSPWQIARKHANVPDHIPFDDEQTTEPDGTHADAACALCHVHDCPYHGMMHERPEGQPDSDDDTDSVDALDLDHPIRVNYKERFLAPPGSVSVISHPGFGMPESSKSMPRHSLNWWMNEENSVTWDHSQRGPFFPCHHPGESCDQADCSCFRDKICCEKTCGCAIECIRRFRGCTCATGRKRKLCSRDDSCECWKMNRECDPDLCGSCEVRAILNPVNRYDDEDSRVGKCGNAAIQLAHPKRTLLGRSVVHGFGLFAGEFIKKHDFIGEYQGEIITGEETERRGVIYEYQKLSYLFDLNQDQMVDSQRMGNKMRFINHAGSEHRNRSTQQKLCVKNVYPRIMLCNSAHRIGMYASKDIEIGEELFFDYGKGYHQTLYGAKGHDQDSKKRPVQKIRKPSVASKNGYKPEPQIARMTKEDARTEDAYNGDVNDDSDDDRPIKRVRRNRKVTVNKPPPAKPAVVRRNAAKKTEDRTHIRRNAPPLFDASAASRPLKAAIKSAPRVRPTTNKPTRETARASSSGTRRSIRNRNASEHINKSEDEGDATSDGEATALRRSGRSRKQSRKLRGDD